MTVSLFIVASTAIRQIHVHPIENTQDWKGADMDGAACLSYFSVKHSFWFSHTHSLCRVDTGTGVMPRCLISSEWIIIKQAVIVLLSGLDYDVIKGPSMSTWWP